MASRGDFGHIEKLESGKWRARYPAPDGSRPSRTFDRRGDARAWLSARQADINRREWRAPEKSILKVGDVARSHIASPELKGSTRLLYADLWRMHLEEWWASVRVVDVTTADVRRWHEGRARAGVGPTRRAQAYRLLRTVLGRAVKDEVIVRNPCTLEKAGATRVVHRPVLLTREQVVAASQHLLPRYRLLPLVALASAERQGEELEMRRKDVSADGTLIQVCRRVYLGKVDTPKSDAGIRAVHLPPSVAAQLVQHMAEWVPDDPEALVFGTSRGTHLSAANLGSYWRKALAAEGLPRVRWHDLRHAAGTEAARKGATPREVQGRLGHATDDAAQRYQHAAASRDAELALRLDED